MNLKWLLVPWYLTPGFRIEQVPYARDANSIHVLQDSQATCQTGKLQTLWSKMAHIQRYQSFHHSKQTWNADDGVIVAREKVDELLGGSAKTNRKNVLPEPAIRSKRQLWILSRKWTRFIKIPIPFVLSKKKKKKLLKQNRPRFII